MPENKLDLILMLLDQHSKQFDEMNKKIDKLDLDLNKKIDKLDSKVDKNHSELSIRIDRLEDKIDRNYDDLKEEIRYDKKKLDAVYESRDKVKVTFGWGWTAASFMVAVLSADIIKIFA